MTRPGRRISFLQLSAHRVFVQLFSYSIDDILRASHNVFTAFPKRDRSFSRIGGSYVETPIWRIAQSIRHELFLQQYPAPYAINLHVNALLPPHCCMENRRSNLDIQGANTPCCNRGLQMHPRVLGLLHVPRSKFYQCFIHINDLLPPRRLITYRRSQLDHSRSQHFSHRHEA